MHTIPGQIPTIAGRSGYLFSRAPFLDGTLKTFFGPGQTPDAVGDAGLPNLYVTTGFEGQSTDAIPIAKDYIPPTEWMEAGQLLYVPQVVYLSLCCNNRGITCTDDINALQVEAGRLTDLFTAVQGDIAALRPNRTWVVIVPWIDISSPNYFGIVDYDITASIEAGSLVPVPFDQSTFANFSLVNTFLFAPTPQAGAKFFGLNFLHVYCGFPLWFDDTGQLQRPASLGQSVINLPGRTTATYSQSTSDPLTFVDSTLVADVLANLVASTPAFVQYTCKAYTTDVATATDGTYDVTDLEHLPELIYQEAFAEKFFTELFADWAESDLDFELAGKTDGLDEATLLALIADHFGFDPSTGLDL